MSQSTETSRVALVTGASRRIGAAIIQGLHQAGFKVVIHYHISQAEAQNLAAALNQLRPSSAFILSCNLLQKGAANGLVEQTMKLTGRLDVLVNNASLFLQAPAENPYLHWDTLFDMNVRAPFLLSHAALPFLAEREGAIVNITDIHAEKPLHPYSVYCMTKAALTMQTKALAVAFAPKVRVNAVAPGSILWPEGQNALDKVSQEKILNKTLLKKHGDPTSIAKAVLSQIENLYVTGQVWAVDGGRTLNT